MALILKTNRPTEPYEVLFDPADPEVRPSAERLAQHESGEGPFLESITFHLRRWNGNDEMHFSNLMMGNREGASGANAMNLGTVHRARVIRGVAKLDGDLQDENGNTYKRVTEESYGLLPGWITKDVLSELNRRNDNDPGGTEEGN